MPCSGNILQPLGIGPLTLRDTFFRFNNVPIPIFVKMIWAILTVASAVGAVVLIIAFTFFLQNVWWNEIYPLVLHH